jgi:hypothetical protein
VADVIEATVLIALIFLLGTALGAIVVALLSRSRSGRRRSQDK